MGMSDLVIMKSTQVHLAELRLGISGKLKTEATPLVHLMTCFGVVYLGQQMQASDSKLRLQPTGLQIRKWFDIGAEGQREDDGFVASGARGTWLRGCTGLWLLTNTHEMKDTRGCSGTVLQMAIRYRNPSNNHMVLKRCTEKLSTGLNYGQSHYHSTDPVVWGYRLSSSDRSTVINNNYQLLGFRIHLQLWREGGGATTDSLRFGVTALSPSFGNSANTTASKQLIIRKPDTMRSNETNQYNILTY